MENGFAYVAINSRKKVKIFLLKMEKGTFSDGLFSVEAYTAYLDYTTNIEYETSFGTQSLMANYMPELKFSPTHPNIIAIYELDIHGGSYITKKALFKISEDSIDSISESSIDDDLRIRTFNIINNDRIIYFNDIENTKLGIAIFDENHRLVKYNEKTMGVSVISADGLYVVDFTASKIYSLLIDYESGEANLEYLRDFPSLIETEYTYFIDPTDSEGITYQLSLQYAFLNGAGNILWLIDYDVEYSSQNRVRVYSVDFNNSNPFHFLFSTNFFNRFIDISADRESISLKHEGGYGGLILETVKDYSKLVALKYEGSYFYRQDPGVLTARPADVTKGVTFIGRNGIPENGTLETSTSILHGSGDSGGGNSGGGSSGGGGGSF